MGAALDHPAAVQHQDAVAADHARQAVRQHQRGAALHQPVQRLLDHRLVLGVDRGQRLVQHQDRRVAQQGAGDGDALALAAGQLHALLADHGPIALRQRLDEAVDVGGAGGGLDLGLGRVRPAHADVVLDRAVEQEGVLGHHRDHRPDLGEGQAAQIVPAEADRALPPGRRSAAAGARSTTCRRRTGRPRRSARRPGPRSSAPHGWCGGCRDSGSARRRRRWSGPAAGPAPPGRHPPPPACRPAPRRCPGPRTGRPCPGAAPTAARASAGRSRRPASG